MNEMQKSAGETLVNAVYNQLRSDIIYCRLEPGSKLVISEICARYGVSLGAVREALSRLSAEQLVIQKAQRGFEVSTVSKEDLDDLIDVRVEIDSIALERSTKYGDLQWESNILATYHVLSNLPAPELGKPVTMEWEEAHALFHRALVSACNSPRLLRLHDTLYEQSLRYRNLSMVKADDGRDINQEHKALMTAVIDRNAKIAVRELAGHLENTATSLGIIPSREQKDS